MNISQHIWLMASWLLYGFLHSILARTSFKKRMESYMKGGYKYYRIIYSSFATITLILLLWFQFTIQTFTLWNVPFAEIIISILMASAGLVIMFICIKKYFYDLSGIEVFIKKITAPTLQQDGLHKIVRHPLYSGTLLFIWSIFLYSPLFANLIACVCITGYTVIGIYLEEQKLKDEYGELYKNYSKKVPMLIPIFLTGGKNKILF